MAKLVQVGSMRIKTSKVNAVLRNLQKLYELEGTDVLRTGELERLRTDAKNTQDGYFPHWLNAAADQADLVQWRDTGMSDRTIDNETRAIIIAAVVNDGVVRLPDYCPPVSKSLTPNPT